MKTTVLLGGDLVPTASNMDRFVSGKDLWDPNLISMRNSADIMVFNLECPLTDTGTPIEKCGPNMKAPQSAVCGIRALNPNAVGIGNNHILDYGSEGLKQTLAALCRENILSFGAGINLHEADQPLIIEKNGIHIGFYAVAEHEFSCADEFKSGANPLDPLRILSRISEIRQTCDFLIVLYHGGREHYPYPSPNLQKRCRMIASAGADLISCQHSHCIGCRETYQGTEIIYGQGNFLFDDPEADDTFRTGLLIKLEIEDDDFSAEYIPVISEMGKCMLAGESERKSILGAYEERSAQISDPCEVERLYREYAERMKDKMMKVFLNGNPLLKAVNLLYGRKTSNIYSMEARRAILNSMQCESLNELLCTVLES